MFQNPNQIGRVLARANKPGRYTDGELGAYRKAWDGAEIRLALAYPDMYEIGMSGLGLSVLYTIVNRLPFALADRTYLPDADLEARMRAGGLPAWALESQRPLKQFDVLGMSLQTELGYTNVLNLLDLAGIPLRSLERGQDDPLVVAGGSCCANPEPMAAFFDAFVIGDGEEAIIEICQALRNSKSEIRNSKLQRLAAISGVYVPAVHDPNRDVIKARHIKELKYEQAPTPLVPLVEVTHDRLTIEIARGCTRGCRFCQAGMAYRPVRFRDQEQVIRLAREGIAASGWEELSLLSLSASDYPDFQGLLDGLNRTCSEQRVAISVPSLRLDSLDQAMLDCLKKIKRSGLTFAPEAGSQRLRDVINKGLTDDHLLSSLEMARRNGWQAAKLYFMVGLPTETQQDLDGIVDLCRRAAKMGLNLRVAISPFVPKPQTPFQWEAQDGLQSLDEKLKHLSHSLRGPRMQASWHDPRSSVIEGALARGGREMSAVIEQAFRLGARFDQWSEHFKWEAWQEAFRSAGLELTTLQQAREPAARLPWAHIDYGVSEKYLKAERDRARLGQATPDCRMDGCQQCGLESICGREKPGKVEKDEKEEKVLKGGIQGTGTPPSSEGQQYGRVKKISSQPVQLARTKFRIKYGKGPELRFISHLDTMRLWQRTIRRAGIPVSYSQGFTPHQKVSFGPPLPLGMTSRAEYLDIQLEKPTGGDIGAVLGSQANTGISILAAKPVFKDVQSLSSLIDALEYRVTFEGNADLRSILGEHQRRKDGNEPWMVEVERKDGRSSVDLMQQIIKLTIINNNQFEIIVKVIDKGAKIIDIIGKIVDIDTSKSGFDIERAEMYHIVDEGLKTPMDYL